ncbi:MAG: hypothetical protein Q9218_002163 [Villophora microphyllina]
MRRSSMRRGSAVLLTILPLLSPAYGLPTYFGNEASVSHVNVERAAIPEPAITLDVAGSNAGATGSDRNSEFGDTLPNIASEGPEHWLPKLRRRQSPGTGGAATGLPGASTITLDVAGSNRPIHSGNSASTIPNIASEGSDHWLIPENIKREAKAEASPAITLDTDYVPPAIELGNQNLGAPKRREVNL